ncbi:pentapeptide repeat-containing protein [Candidatus Poribacteria bacterium]|nr:pentapeptide repeat-containing protein [Candidatus Poribacteria bacterium]MBT5714017.1 pentapeptide repeat-containing protein [Candidatus Poribacteria bacterium]MBT7100211.1 pentapeptide repeat-containing protein [Candidatus Poribacteria bacterium]MBT7807639.1 pentapeptide repeat-containing protein [Candidatus Poribacteria bacterium]
MGTDTHYSIGKALVVGKEERARSEPLGTAPGKLPRTLTTRADGAAAASAPSEDLNDRGTAETESVVAADRRVLGIDEVERIVADHASWLSSAQGGDPGAPADFSRSDLTAIPANMLAGEDLRSARFTQARLRGLDLAGATLVEADFAGADIADACFDHADTRGALFTDADLSRASFEATNLDGACFDGADVRHARFDDSTIRRGSLVGTDVTSASFRGADLDSADFGQANGAHWEQFGRANLAGAAVPFDAANLEPLDLLRRLHRTMRACLVWTWALAVAAAAGAAMVSHEELLLGVFLRIPAFVWGGACAALPVVGCQVMLIYARAAWSLRADLPAVFPDGETPYARVRRSATGLVSPLELIGGLGADGAQPARDLAAVFVAGCLPALVTVYAWWVSLPLHDAVLTLTQAGLLVGCAGSVTSSWQHCMRAARPTVWEEPEAPRLGALRRLMRAAATVAFILAILGASAYFTFVSRIDLDISGVTVSVLPVGLTVASSETLSGTTGPELAGRDLRGMNAEKAVLINAMLRGADLAAANLTHADLRGADMAYADLRGADMTHIKLTSAGLQAARLGSASLTRADLTAADLSGARMPSADLRGARATGARLDYATMRGANFTAADMTAASVKAATLADAVLARAILKGADMRHSGLRGADLAGADLTGAILYRADMRDADLSRADLTDADLTGARLTNAILAGADLRGSGLGSAILGGASYTEDTRFPEGFLPELRGMVDTTGK